MFYQLTQITLTQKGIDYLENHPEAEWGCRIIPDDEEIEKLYNERNDRWSRRPITKRLNLTFEEFKKRWFSRPEIRWEFINTSVRGFFENKDDFDKMLDELDGHTWIHEGYYTHFIVTPKVFGIDVMSKDWEQLYYKMDENGIIKPCEPFVGLENTIF